GSIAFSLASGHGFSAPFRRDSGPTAWLAPVYPVFLAVIFRIFGPFTLPSFYAALAFNILLSTLTAVPLYFAAKRIAGVTVAALAAWLWVIFPSGFVIPFEWIWDTCLSAFLGAAILWATLAIRDYRTRSAWLSYGALWGIALLTNPSFAALLPFFFLW